MSIAAALLLALLPIFEVIHPAGIDFVHQNSSTSNKYLIETMGGGVAVLDYNNDGLPDIFFVNSGRIAGSLPANPDFSRNDKRYWNRLYRQEKNGTFTDVTEAAGLQNAGNGNYGMGVATADYDNDGFTDLYVTSYGHNLLYHNNGNGTFSDVTMKAGVAGAGWSVSAGFLDFDNDGKLDLFVTRYMEWDGAHSKVCTRQTYCPPGDFPKTTNLLFRNKGDGTFQDVSLHSGIAKVAGRSLGVAFNDYDGDGYTDIFVANDGMEQFLFNNNRNGTFTEKALEAGVSLGDDGKPYAGMGVDFRDYDNDGRPDILVTDLAKQTYALYHNDGEGAFSYRSRETGLGVLTSANSGWGMRLEDFDNDGQKDLLVAQSHVMDNVESIDPSLHYKQAPLLALARGGRFELADVGTTDSIAGRGVAFADLNNDGWMDAVIGTLGGKPMFLLNKGGYAHWLILELEGTRSNRDGFGALVMVGDQHQYVESAGSYASGSDKRVHFGLGSNTQVSVKIHWPSGIDQTLPNVRADQILHVREGSGAP